MKRRITAFLTIAACMTAFSVTAGAQSETTDPEMTAVPEETVTAETVEFTKTVAVEESPEVAQFETMADLYNHWCMTATGGISYPDYVCGVWTETGDMSQLVVAVTKDEKGEAGKQEILSLIEKDDSVSFTYQTYSFRELYEANEYVTEKLVNANVMNWGCGIGEMENVVNVGIDTSSPEVQQIMNDCFAAYGDMIRFNDSAPVYALDAEEVIVLDEEATYDAGGGAVTTAEETKPDWLYTTAGEEISADEAPVDEIAVETAISIAEAPDTKPMIFLICGGVIILAGVAAFTINKSRVKATNAGNVTDGRNINTAQVEKIIELETVEPQMCTFENVMNKIDG